MRVSSYLLAALSAVGVTTASPSKKPFFYKGHDLSSLQILEDGGASYKDTARGNATRPVEDILGDGGMNTVRLRLWVNPTVPFDGPPGCTYMSFNELSLHHLPPRQSELTICYRLRDLQPRLHSIPSKTLPQKGLQDLPRLPFLRLLGRSPKTSPTRRLAQDSHTPRQHPAQLRLQHPPNLPQSRRGPRPRQSRERDPPRHDLASRPSQRRRRT